MKNTILIHALALLTLSCGYQFTGGGVMPGNIGNLHVSPLENPTGETGIESILANDLINCCLRNGITLSGESKTADAVLKGRITGLNIRSVAHSGIHSATARRVTLTLEVRLVSAAGATLWSRKGISDSQVYNVGDNKQENERSRREAIKEISRRLGETVYHSLTSGF